MFDSLKFAVADSYGKREPMELTALGLLSFLCDRNLITDYNAYDICNWLAHAKPHQQFNNGNFRIYTLPY